MKSKERQTPKGRNWTPKAQQEGSDERYYGREQKKIALKEGNVGRQCAREIRNPEQGW